MFLAALLAAIGRHFRIRAAERALAELDTTMLADLGISRGEIASARHGRQGR